LVYKCGFASGGFPLQLGNLCPDGLPFGRTDNAVLEGFPKDGNFFLVFHMVFVFVVFLKWRKFLFSMSHCGGSQNIVLWVCFALNSFLGKVFLNCLCTIIKHFSKNTITFFGSEASHRAKQQNNLTKKRLKLFKLRENRREII